LSASRDIYIRNTPDPVAGTAVDSIPWSPAPPLLPCIHGRQWVVR